jgi:site-specific DNA-methyltransferase (cytosine-N4-specific)
MTIFYKTRYGEIILDDAIKVLKETKDSSVSLIITSPPFGLVRKKDYGNVDAEDYLEWFRQFASEFYRVLAEDGSFVIDIGGSWNPGTPTRSLYHFKLLIMFCEEYGFHLAQEYYWWNPSKLPTPAEWVNIRRVRVKDAVNCVWWLSKTPYPKATNKRVLQPYSDSMLDLLKNGYKAKKRPSGHDISEKFSNNNKAAIPPNLLAIPNTESNSFYLKYCREHNIKPHPARFPDELPEYFIRMLTDENDLVIDPFAGSCITGKVCERLSRKWMCVDLVEEYLQGALAHFHGQSQSDNQKRDKFYKIPMPGILWKKFENEELIFDGGKQRPKRLKETP